MEPTAVDSSSTSSSESRPPREFAARVAGFAALQTGGVLVFLLLYGWAWVPGNSYMAASLDKAVLLRDQASPRVILVGGSNLAFGMDSGTLQARLDRNPVNMGLHAALGLPYMLNEVLPHLRLGDVVVLSPEYEHFGATLLEFPIVHDLLRWNPGAAFAFATTAYLPTLLDGGFIEIGSILRDTRLWPTAAADQGPVRNTQYRRGAFNAFGDVAASSKLAAANSRISVIPEFPELAVRSAIQQINNFERKARGRGAVVFFSYSPCPQSRMASSRGALEGLHEMLSRHLVPVLLDQPKDLVIEDSFFLDTHYHLDEAGTRRRTEHLAARLAAALASPGRPAP